MERAVAAPAALGHHGADDDSRPTKAMRGAAAARKALGLTSVFKPDSPAGAAVSGEGNCDFNSTVFDRGSCNRSANYPSYSKDVSSASARDEEVSGLGTDSRFRTQDHEGESVGDGRQPRARTGSAGVAAEDLQVSFSSEMKIPKEEQTTIGESEDAAGVNESSLAKLKRKIRLKLLAEEARTTQLFTVKAEEGGYINNSNGRQEKRLTDEGPSSTRIRPAKLNGPCPPQQHNHQQQLSQRACEQPLKTSYGTVVRSEGRIIVDLTSDDEPCDISKLPRYQEHHSLKTSQAPGAASVPLVPKVEEDETYSAVLERVLRPLIARAAAAVVADQSATRPEQTNRSAGELPGKKGRKQSSKKSNLSAEAPLSAGMDSLGIHRSQNTVFAPGGKKRVGDSSNINVQERRKRGRPRKGEETKSAVAKPSRPANNKGATTPVPNSYERERELNILRNKAFLSGLNLCTRMETRKLMEPGPETHDIKMELGPTPAHESYGNPDPDQDCDLTHNDDLDDYQRSQITCALSRSSSEMEQSEKTPTSDDDVDYDPRYDPEDHLEENGDKEDYNSSRPPSSQGNGRSGGKSSQKGKEKACRGRPRKGKKASIPKLKLAKIIAGLLTSKRAGTLPPKLLEQLANSSIGDDSDYNAGTSRRGRSAASKKSLTEPVRQQKEKRKAERVPSEPRPGSPTSTTPSAGSAGKKQRTATWLASIPFETPKTEYEMLRDEALRRKKETLEKLGVAPDLMDEERDRPREKRAYNKRWTAEPDPVFTRQTRLRDRQHSHVETVEVKMEIVDLVADDETKEKPDPPPSFGHSSVAKFSNWAPLQRQRSAGPNSREWDLNEPLTSAGERVVSFEARGGQEQLVDLMLTRITSMHVGAIRGQYSGLLAAGGMQGRIAVFALRDSAASSSHGREKTGTFLDDDENEAKAPLLAWTVDNSWISQVVFLPTQFKEKEMLLLSSSNDGRVVLWDINSVRIQRGTREMSQEGMPRVVCHTTTLHSGSIFGMHEMEGRMATASEDGVGISAIRETMIFMEKCSTGHHSGAIRNIRFRDKNILADCGEDMVIGILDLRVSDPCTLKLPTGHKTAINVVEWSPESDNVLLSASLDPQIYLHDIRSPRNVSHALEGHVHPRRQTCQNVYRPTFADGGHTVVTPAEGTHQLALYAVDTGCAVGKVPLGHDTTTVVWNGLVPTSQGGLWAGSDGITPCRPIWGLPHSSSQHRDGKHEEGQMQNKSSPYSDGGTSMTADLPVTEKFEELL